MDNAIVGVLARCARRRMLFQIVFEEKAPGDWCAVRRRTPRTQPTGGHGKAAQPPPLPGRFHVDPAFPGCPYCGARSFSQCGSCGQLTCWPGDRRDVACAWCGVRARIGGPVVAVTPAAPGGTALTPRASETRIAARTTPLLPPRRP